MIDSVSFLRELISIPSPSGEEAAVGAFLVERMEGMGFRAYLDEVGNAVGVAGNPAATRKLVMLGHMDTVPGDVPVRIHKNLLYGRGTVDAKGPLAAFVLAAARVLPRLKTMQIVVIGAVEEEAHSKGARYLERTMAAPELAIIGEPSGWEGITLGYKGRLYVDYRRVQSSSHSAGQELGPAEKAVSFWNNVMDYAEARNQGRSGRFDTLDPALRDFQMSSDGLNDVIKMSIAVRLPPDFNPEVLKRKMLQWRDDAELDFSPLDLPFQCDKNNPLVRALLKAIRAEGGTPRFKLKTGTSDMNTVGPTWKCPIVAYGPGDSSLDHTPDEHVELLEFQRGVNVLARALETLAG
ncbi:MAG: [LysW]-lysine hydrolase [Thermoflexales bacterium]|nr:[LysW]-lysine hydrolase [Thermoflexales bacterium]